MMALTGIVFSIAFVLVQFNAVVYSPRLVVWFARDRLLFHSLGMFVATFIYSLSTLAWVDRAGSGSVPLLSSLIVALLLAASVLLLARLVQRLNNLQITRVLHILGDTGRDVIRSTYQPTNVATSAGRHGTWPRNLPHTVSLDMKHVGRPRTVTWIDIHRLAKLAQQVDGVIVVECAVGDTLLEETSILRVYGAKLPVAEEKLRRAIHLGDQRTFEQDPKYALRLLVDIAIKALSPAINDPTTAVQAIDQIEDLLRRLSRRRLDAGYARDSSGLVRVVFPVPSWQDYLALSFDEIRQFGSTSVQGRTTPESGAGWLGRHHRCNEPARSGAAVSRSFDPQCRALSVRRSGSGHGLTGRSSRAWTATQKAGM